MRGALALLLICVVHPAEMLAQARGPETGAISNTPAATALSQPRTLRNAIDQEARRLTLARGRIGGLQAPAPSARGRSWIRRHPALFGALVGAGAGAVSSAPRWTELYCATGGDEDCLFHGGAGVLFGAGAGAGIGALIGFFAGR
jgi:hypothetical protein